MICFLIRILGVSTVSFNAKWLSRLFAQVEKSTGPIFIRTSQQPLNQLLGDVDFAKSLFDMPQCFEFVKQP
jgi:hypothetical protein